MSKNFQQKIQESSSFCLINSSGATCKEQMDESAANLVETLMSCGYIGDDIAAFGSLGHSLI